MFRNCGKPSLLPWLVPDRWATLSRPSTSFTNRALAVIRKLHASGRRLVEHVIQRLGCRRRSLAAGNDFLGGNALIVDSLVSIVIGVHRRAFQGYAGKQSLRA